MKQGKDYRQIVATEKSSELRKNALKIPKVDSGGTQGIVPQSILDIVTRIQAVSVQDGGKILYDEIDERMFQVRVALEPRLTTLEAKAALAELNQLHIDVDATTRCIEKRVLDRHTDRHANKTR